MADIGSLTMKIKADASNFNKGMAGVKKSVGTIAKTAGVAAVAAGAAMGAIGIKAIQMGADAEEARNKYDVVFKGMTDTVDEWSTDFASKVGRSKFAIQESLSNLADLQQGLGMTKDESFDLSNKIVTLATDLASFNNVQDDVAIDAISKAMLGEAESAKQLGLLLNVDRVKDYAEAQGHVWAEVTDAERAQLTYNLALKQSKNAIGDAERSNQSFTNQMKALKTGVGDTVTELGMKLIPIATDLVKKLNIHVVPALSGFIDKAVEVGTKIAEWAQPKIEKFTKFIQDNFPKAKEKAIELFEKMMEKAEGVKNFYETHLQPIVEKLQKFVVDNYPAMKETVESVFGSIGESIEVVWKLIDEHLLPAFGDIAEEAEENFPNFLQTVKDTFGGAADVIKTVADAIDAVLDAYEKFNNILPEIMQTKPSDFTPFGIMKNFGLLPDDSGNAEMIEQASENKNETIGERALREAEEEFGTPTTKSIDGSVYEDMYNFRKNEGSVTNINVSVTGNTVMGDRDIDNFTNKITDRLKGVNIR